MKKKLLIIAFFLLVYLLASWSRKALNPDIYNLLQNDYDIKKIIYEEQYGKNKYMIVGINARNTLTCCLFEKKIYGKKILEVSSEVPIEEGEEKSYFLCSTFDYGKNWIYWGIIWDNSIKEVLIDGCNAKIISLEEYNWRLCYRIGCEQREEISIKPILV